MGLGLWAQSAADVRPPRAPASAPHTAAAGKDPCDPASGNRRELPGPHANSVRYWSSPPLIRGLVRALKANEGPPASRGALVVLYAPFQEKVRLCRLRWPSVLVHLVCLVQTCEKGPYLYLCICSPVSSLTPKDMQVRNKSGVDTAPPPHFRRPAFSLSPNDERLGAVLSLGLTPGAGGTVLANGAVLALDAAPSLPPVSYTHLTLPTICSV